MASWVSSIVLAIAEHAGPAVSFIAGSTASYVVEKFIDMGISFLSKHMLPVDSEAELKRLQTALPQIRAVLVVAEALKMKEPSCSEWVEQFRQAVDAAEDVLDELEYKNLEATVKNRDEVIELGGFVSSSKKNKIFAISDEILGRLKEAITLLDQAVAGVGHLLQLATMLGIRRLSESQKEVGTDLRRETTSFLAEREVFGRDVEKDKIIVWLKRPTQARISSFCIVGVGGLGKTTLAQFAYQEMNGSDYFEKTIWVSISTDFSVRGITTKILGELRESSCGDNSLNVLQEILKEETLPKKILLIMDDVWEDEKRGDWEQVIAPLMFVREGSKILLTTRMKSVSDLVASVINTEHESLTLQDLEEGHLQLLFNSYAFYGFNPNNYGDLQVIGDQIVKKLQGSPLAAKVIGSLLNSRINLDYWRRILNHESLINLEQVKDVMDVLKLSYYNLPADLQVCFRFCSIFPQDYEFDKNELIKMWVASGFIRQQTSQEERQEDIGEDYFNHLLRKSFFEISKSSRWQRYVMHDLMHELATNVSNGECCRVEPNDKSIAIPSTVRHVSIHESEIRKVSHLTNMRSLFITTCKVHTMANPNLFVLPNNLIKRSLRLLKIYGYRSCKLPEEISCLVLLRYLSLELGDFKYFLPFSICKLYHLQVLDLIGDSHNSFYSGIEKTGMTNLVSLRYMRLPSQMYQNICGVHGLTSLQELTFFVGKESGYRINELGTPNNLRYLTIYNTENIGGPAEASSANLKRKKSLRSLSLSWNSRSNLDSPEKIIDNLQPTQSLEKLEIENYEGQRSPIWMEDTIPLNLSSFKLCNCQYLKQLIFGQMPYLKILEIYWCPNIEKLPDMPLSLTEFRIRGVGLTSLPNLFQSFGTNTLATAPLKSSLRLVEIIRCPNLISLNGFLQQEKLELQGLEELTVVSCENLAQLPIHTFRTCLSLKLLCIRYCPSLTRLPCLPLSLITLEICETTVNALPEHFKRTLSSGGQSTPSLKSSLREIYIEKCPNLTALNGFFQQDDIDFQAVNKIYICGCEKLIHIPIGEFWKFVLLTDLTIDNCPKVVAVDNQNNFLPSKLKSLFMRKCGELDMPLLESSSHLIALTDLKIEDCPYITHIPSSNVFGSLCKLSIKGCGKLIELSLRQQVHNVDQGSNLASLKISDISIDQLSLLLLEPLRSLRFVCDLLVHNCSRIVALPEQWLLQNGRTLKRLHISNASTLQSLPATILRLTSLEKLAISCADLLVELPDLPASLKEKIHIQL